MSRYAFAAAFLLAAAPAAAVPTTGEPEQQAAASPADRLRATIEQIRAEMLKPGEIVPGWNVGGADPDAALRARGADGHYFLVAEGEQRDVEIVTAKRIDDFAPARWRRIDSYGSPVAYAEDPSIAFMGLGTRYYIGARGDSYRENDLDCGRKITHAILYEDPEAPEDGTDRQTAIGLFRLTLLAVEGQVICSRSEGDAEKGWTARYMLPDGRDLPALNDPVTHISIVPAAPVDTLVKAEPLKTNE